MINYLKKLFSSDSSSEADGKLSKQNEKDFDIFKYDGIRAMRMGKTDYAEKCFLKAIEIKPESETLRLLSSLYANMGKNDKAIEVLQKIIDNDQTSVDAYVSMAALLLTVDKYAEAKDIANKALALEPANSMALLLLGKSEFRLGNELDAIVCLTKSIESKHDNIDALLERANVLNAMSQISEAMQDVEDVLSIDGENESAMLLKADLLIKKGDNEAAEKTYDTLLDINPFDVEAYLGKAKLEMSINEPLKAKTTLDTALDLLPNDAQLYKERGRAKLMAGDKEGAASDMKKFIELDKTAESEITGQFTNKAAEFDNIVGIFK